MSYRISTYFETFNEPERRLFSPVTPDSTRGSSRRKASRARSSDAARSYVISPASFDVCMIRRSAFEWRIEALSHRTPKSSADQPRSDPVGSLSLHRRGHVTVEIHEQGRIRMPKALSCDLRCHAIGEAGTHRYSNHVECPCSGSQVLHLAGAVRNSRACSGLQWRGTERLAFGLGACMSGSTATIPLEAASLKAPASGARQGDRVRRQRSAVLGSPFGK